MAIELQATQAAPKTESRRFSLPQLLSTNEMSAKDRMFFTERLALLLETGHPLHTGLQTMTRHASSPAVRHIVDALQADLGAGLSFSQALAKHGDAFPNTYVNLVRAGEAGGFLPKVLTRLTEMEERREELRATLVGALAYPGFLVVLSLAVVAFVLVVVFPKFSELFTMIKDELPLSTVVLMGASDVLRRWWPLLIAMGIGGGLGLHQWARTAAGGRQLENLALRLPLIGRTFVEFNLVLFLRVFGLSLGNGVPVLDALRSSRDVVRGARFRDVIDALEGSVEQGRGLALSEPPVQLLPELARQMLATGEESGNLALVCERVADFYEREWRKKLQLVAKLTEPAMLVLMGGVVGLIVASLILPIFKLSRAVH